MYKKRILSILTIITLCLILNTSCSNNKSHYELKDFSIKDTASITSFRISNTENKTIEITRKNKDKTWVIGGTSYNASKASVELLMETFYRIRVKQNVPNSALNTIFNRLSVRYKKVEIFTDTDFPIKTWYIGSPTQDHLGTYMLLQQGDIKSDVPYITYKPGMYGSLDVRFFTGIENWRSTKVFDYSNANDILSVKVQFKNDPENSYSIKRENEKVLLKDNFNKLLNNYDTIQVKHYLTHFNKINYNKNMMFKKEIRDSLLSIAPDYYFELHDNKDVSKIINLWKIKDENSETGWDKEYGVININHSKELLRVQFFNWDILFKPLSYFKKNNSN